MYSLMKAGFLYLVPSFMLFTVFLFYKTVRTAYLSRYITDMQGTSATFIDIENFTYLFTSPAFLTSAKATVLFVLYTVPIGVILALCLALFANSKLRENHFFRKLFSSTIGMSVAASSVIWMFMYNPTIEVINYFLIAIGYSEIQWLLDPSTALIAVSIGSIWMNIGFCFFILLGGLQNIDSQLYESASIAGVSGAYKLRKIIIPMLLPTLFFVITVSFINAFQTFGQIEILTKDGPIESMTTFVDSIYKDTFINYNIGSESAILFFCIFIVTIAQFKFVARKLYY